MALIKITQRECLDKAIEGMIKAVDHGAKTLEDILVVLESIEDKFMRAALEKFAGDIDLVGDYIRTSVEFYEQVDELDKKNHVFVEDGKQIYYMTKEEYKKRKVQEEPNYYY